MNTEEKLVSLSEKYIFNETVASLLLLLNSALEQKSEGRKFEENYNVSEDLKEIRRKIKNYILSMDTVLLDGEVRKNALEECIKMKKQLVSIYKIIYRYFAKLNVVATMVSDEVAVRKYKEDSNVKDKKIELSLFYRDCVEFLQSSESENELMHHIGELFECVPLKMTREKYFAIMEKSLSEAFKDASKGEIEFSLEFFANTCAPEFSEGYGKYFPEIADFLKDTSSSPSDFDMILTGDLGKVGSRLLCELLQKDRGIDIESVHADCGLLLYDAEKQDVHAGGSGCGCGASVLNSYIMRRLESGELSRVLFVATGALMSPTSSLQGESIPSIAHAVLLSKPT